MQCQMAIAEGFTNAVRHAHGEEFKEYPIGINLTLAENTLDIRIWDHGKQNFDLEHYIANLDMQVNEFASGGRGIIILKKIASKLAYQRDQQRQQNCLLISKTLTNRLAPFFISAEKLGDRLSDPNLVIIDCRFRLGDTEWGRAEYQKSHIPGAYYLHLDEDLSSPIQEHGGRHPLPAPEKFVETLSQLGIERGKTEVVVYDDLRFAFAARLWWLLKFYGHDNVSILDGGFAAWEKAGCTCCADIPDLESDKVFQENRRSHLVVGRDELLAAKDRQLVVLDCRDAARYRGEVEPIDPIAGSIPGAMNSPWKAVSDENGFAQSFEQQQKLWQDYPKEQELILYCGSGVTACVNWLSLEITGHTNLKLYAGGWSDWCSYVQ